MTLDTTLDITIRVTLILLAAIAAGVLLRRSSAAARHLVGVLGLGAVLALPFAAGLLPAWNVPLLDAEQPAAIERPDASIERPTAPVERRAPAGLPVELGPANRDAADASLLAPRATSPVDGIEPAALRLPDPPADRIDPVDDRAGSSFASEASRDADAGTLAAGGALARTSGLGRTLFAFLWVGGAAFLLARLAVGWWSMARMARRATPLDDGPIADLARDAAGRLGLSAMPTVRVSDALRVPVLWGLMRPVLLLPESARAWSTDRLRVVLLHELAHLRRRDGLALLVGRVAAAFWWFHPMVWIVERRVRQDCERACDDLVLTAGERASEYARHLLEVARELPRNAAPRPAAATALSVLGAGRLERRLRSILAPQAARRLRPAAALALALAVATTFALVATVQPTTRAAAGLQSVEEPFPIPAPELSDEPSPEPTRGRASEPMPALRLEPGPEPRRGERDVAVDRDRDRDRNRPRNVIRDVLRARWDGEDASDYRDGKDVYDRAYDLHRDERWAEAAAAFERSASMGFRPGTSLYNAACGHAKLGQAGRAVELLRRSIYDHGFDAASLIRRDSDLDPIRRDPAFTTLLDELESEGLLRGDRKYGAVLDQYRGMLDRAQTGRDDVDGKAWYKIGSKLLSLREFDPAIDALQRAVDLLEVNYNAHYNLACAHALRGDVSAAATSLEAAVLAGFDSEERFENDSDLDNLRGTQEFDRIRELHDFLSLDRFDDNSWNWFGVDRSEYSETRWKPAIEEYSAYVQRNPDVGRAWSNLGWALHFSRRHAEARDAFLKQLDLDYRPGTAAYNVGCTYAMQGNADEALRWLRTALEDHDFGNPGQLASDDDLDALHDDPRFEQLLRDSHAKHGGRYGHDRDDGDHVLHLIEKLRDTASDWL